MLHVFTAFKIKYIQHKKCLLWKQELQVLLFFFSRKGKQSWAALTNGIAFPSLWALSGLLSIINLGRDGEGEQRLLGRRESQWMAGGCHLGILLMWNWTSLQRTGLQRDWEREKWLENKQQKVLKARTNRGGHNCDLGPGKSLKVNWE